MGYFLDKLKEARVEAGFSQAKAAEVAGVSRENYNSFENGKRPLTEERLRLLTLALGIPESTWKAWLAIDEFGADALVEAYHILHAERPRQA